MTEREQIVSWIRLIAGTVGENMAKAVVDDDGMRNIPHAVVLAIAEWTRVSNTKLLMDLAICLEKREDLIMQSQPDDGSKPH